MRWALMMMRLCTNAEKLRIAVVGDSLAAGIGYFAQRVFELDFTDVVKQGRISTGLLDPTTSTGRRRCSSSWIDSASISPS